MKRNLVKMEKEGKREELKGSGEEGRMKQEKREKEERMKKGKMGKTKKEERREGEEEKGRKKCVRPDLKSQSVKASKVCAETKS